MNKITGALLVIAAVFFTLTLNNLLIIKDEHVETTEEVYPKVTEVNILEEIRIYFEWNRAYIYHEQYKWQQTQIEEDNQTIDINDKIVKIDQYLSVNYPSSPLRAEWFFDNAPSPEAAILAMSVSRSETAFGTDEANYYNAWGIFCYRPDATLDCGWDNWEYSTSRIFDKDVTGSYYAKFDGTKEDFRATFENKYCVSECGSYIDNTWEIYSYFINL